MAKLKSAYFCQNCGYEAPKWLGKCPSCGEWNTFVEEMIEKSLPGNIVAFSKSGKTSKPTAILDIQGVEQERYQLDDQELYRVRGGGLVLVSLILFGGEPGIGKSTLMLQLAIANNQLKVLYVSGEESEQQIKMRAERIGVQNANCFILSETNIQNIFKQAEEIEPKLLVIDSIQTL